MSQGKTKVYIYTRVSTTMQIDDYSLDAQKARMKAYADFNNYQIVGEYEDAGKSGKSIEGRASFCKMMDDINPARMVLPMCWCSSSPGLAAILPMYCLPCR